MTIPVVENASAALFAALAESAIRGLLLALVMGLVLTVFRVRRTVWRLSAWTIVLFAALAMPALGRVVPSLSLPMMNVPALAWMGPAAPNVQADSGRPALEQPASNSSRLATAQPPSRGASIAQPSVAGSAPSATPQLPSLVVVLLGAYLIGVMTLSVRAAMGWIATRRLERDARAMGDADILARVDSISRAAGCQQPPRLAESDRLHVPVTVSVVRPMVILPDTWRSWDNAMLDAVLVHEVAHVARRDALTQRAALLHRAIFWFNPLAWWLQHHLTDLAEQASDEAVLSAGTSQTYYARVLLDFFRALPQPGFRANWHVAMARGAAANAEARVDRILTWKGGQAMRLTKSTVMSVVMAALPVVALTAAVRPGPAAPHQQATVVPVQAVTAPTAPVAAPAQSVPAPSSVQSPPQSAVATTVVQTPSSSAAVSTTPTLAPKITIEAPVQPQVPATAADAPGQVDFGAGLYKPGTNGVSWPKVIRESKPKYPMEAMRANIRGAVELEVVVLPDGTVGPMRILRSLDTRYGLDSEAVRAARQWIFEPAQRAGQPVPALVALVLEFRTDATEPPRPDGSPASPRPLADAFASGAYFQMSTTMVAPQHVGDRGQATIEASINPGGSVSKAQQVGLAAPKIKQQVMAKYTPDAMRAKLQGQVEVEAIVMPDGTVGKVRVVRSLDKASGLDEAALVAARQSTFTPGTLDGTPVPVLVTMRFDFRLH